MSDSDKKVQPDTPVTVAARTIVSRNLKRTWRLFRLAARKWEKDVEYVHQLRISTRRSLAALEAFREYLPANRRERVIQQLKSIRKVAAQARDIDFMIQQQQAAKSKNRKLSKHLNKQRRKAQKPILASYDSIRRENSFRRECRKMLASLDRFESSSQPDFCTWSQRKLAILIPVFISQIPDDLADLSQLHRFRIEAKKFRYALEVFRPALKPGVFEKLKPQIRQLQDMLGKANDHAVAIEYYRRMKPKKTKSEVINQEALQNEIAELEAAKLAFRDWWTTKSAADFRQRLESLIMDQPLSSDVKPVVSDGLR